MLRTPRRARPPRVARVAAGVARDRAQTFAAIGIANVVHEGPGAIEGGRAEKIRARIDHVAGGITNAAADAFDTGVGGGPRGRIGLDYGELIAPRALAA